MSNPNPNRSRLTLLLVAVAFLAPFTVAMVLRFGGWQPGQTRNHGELLQPPLEMVAVDGQMLDGSSWRWENTDHEWTLLARSANDCDASCDETFALLRNVRTSLARHAPRLHLFRLGESAPGGFAPLRLAGELPAPLTRPVERGVEVFLVDPHGYLVLHYAPGFDPSGLRRDLSRLIK